MLWTHKIRVRYGECDQMGFVHHSVYALYFEEARTEILRQIGLIYREMEEEGIIMPVRSMVLNFKKAAKYDDLLEINIKVAKYTGIRVLFEYEVYNQNGTFLCDGNTELFFVAKNTMKPMMLPAIYSSKLIKDAKIL
jgi:acyl-CoA thioester hydrolase